jgi:MFS transporter, SP family, sugar:H+ symporter
MTAQMKPWGPFALFCAFTACGTIYIYFAFPECKNRSIEDMDIFFSMSWWKAGRASLRMNKEDAMQAILENKENGGKLFDSAVEKFSSSYIEETDVQRVRSS